MKISMLVLQLSLLLQQQQLLLSMTAPTDAHARADDDGDDGDLMITPTAKSLKEQPAETEGEAGLCLIVSSSGMRGVP